MTSKEILKKYIPTNEAGECAADKDWNPLVREDYALKAMDEYAKQQCIAFQRWILLEGIRFDGIGCYKSMLKGGDTPYSFYERVDICKTLEELYEKFIEHQSKQV